MQIRKLMKYPYGFLKYDITAGIVVFLVAIPLCLGVALASGAPLFSGLISGFLGGILVGIISGSRVSVSGPAAGMVTVVLAAITQLGFETFLLALLFAGILQIIIGSLRAGFIADYIPSNVIQGLLCAIGILIIVKQLPFALTYTTENELLLESLKEIYNNLYIIPSQIEDIAYHFNLGATIIAAISIGLLIFFDNTKHPKLKNIPGPIIVVALGILINEIYLKFWPDLSQFSTELVNIPVQNIQSFFLQFKFPNWQSWTNFNVYLYGFILAAVASLEALLNLEAIEKLDKSRRFVSRNRELVAQGVGNACSGLIGGLPITSVIVRSSVNMQARAKSKLSTIIHGFLILLVAILIPHWMNLVPLASLAAILIYVGFKLTKPRIYKEMYAQGVTRFLPFIITVLAIVFSDLLSGILIGLFFSFFFILRDNSKIHLDSVNEKHPSGIVKRLILPQHLSFLTKAALIEELNKIPAESRLIIDARNTKYIDQDIMEVIQNFKNRQAPSKRIALNMIGFKDHYEIHNHIDFINVTTYDLQSSLTPNQVLDILREGNKRFVKDQRINRSLLDEIKATSSTQHPIAIVLSCIDSRVPVETIFDMGVGDVFVVRIAGNVINDDIIASMEFACHIAGAKLILVLGHTYCGAIKAACDDKETIGILDELLAKIKIAIDEEKTTSKNRTSENLDFLNNITKINIENSLSLIYGKSMVLTRLINDGNIGLIGAIYDIQSGKVVFDKSFFTHKNYKPDRFRNTLLPEVNNNPTALDN